MEQTIRVELPLPEEMHRHSKASAALEGVTLRDWIIEAVRQRLERSKTVMSA